MPSDAMTTTTAAEVSPPPVPVLGPPPGQDEHPHPAAPIADAPVAHFPAEVLADPIELTRALCDIESVSGNEQEITDAVEAALRTAAHLSVDRIGNVVRA